MPRGFASGLRFLVGTLEGARWTLTVRNEGRSGVAARPADFGPGPTHSSFALIPMQARKADANSGRCWG
jgi:hypothetical protein